VHEGHRARWGRLPRLPGSLTLRRRLTWPARQTTPADTSGIHVGSSTRCQALARLLTAAIGLSLLGTPAYAEGDVLVNVDSTGVAHILGDDAPNSIRITSEPAERTYRIDAVDGTRVNGLASVIVTGVRGLRLDMEDGNDTVEIEDVGLSRHLVVRLGDGHDLLVLDGVRVRGRTMVRAGDGQDVIRAVGDCVFRRSVVIKGEDGIDTIRVEEATLHRRMRLVGGEGNDDVFVIRTVAGAGARVDVDTARGADVVKLRDSRFHRDVDIQTGRDDDFVELDNCRFDDDVDIDLGRDDDDLRIEDSTFKDDVEAEAARGHDELDLDGGNDFDRRSGTGFGERGHKVRFHSFEHRH